MNIIAFIPARGGSKRVPRKNLRPLAGQPLLVHAIRSAVKSGIFSRILVSTDNDEVESVAILHGVEVRKVGPPCHVDDCADIVWVRDAVQHCGSHNAFAILRPSSPFRTADTIQRAWNEFRTAEVHSLRAVQPVTEHPGKMWQCAGKGYPMHPLIGSTSWPFPKDEPFPHRQWTDVGDPPFHSRPTQTLPQVYIQNASLEMAWTYVVDSFGTISGTKVAPFFTNGHEGFDINTEDDWLEAERIAVAHPDLLPRMPSLT